MTGEVQVIQIGDSSAVIPVYASSDSAATPIYVPGSAVGEGATTLAALNDVDVVDAPVDVPLVWVRHPDGIFRTTPLPDEHEHWEDADDIRVGAGTPNDEAPLGVLHVDFTTGKIYRNGS